MTKKLNEEQISNELNESAFFRKTQSPSSPSQRKGEQDTESESISESEPTFKRRNEPTNVRSNERTNETEKERKVIRHTFDIYADQLASLHFLQLSAVRSKMKKPKLGIMVQEALDMYLDSKLAKRERTIEPTNERDNERI